MGLDAGVRSQGEPCRRCIEFSPVVIFHRPTVRNYHTDQKNKIRRFYETYAVAAIQVSHTSFCFFTLSFLDVFSTGVNTIRKLNFTLEPFSGNIALIQDRLSLSDNPFTNRLSLNNFLYTSRGF